MVGPSNKVNNLRPGYRLVQRRNRNQVRANPSTTKKNKGTFSGGMSKKRRGKGIVKKRKVNVSTNSTPSGKKLRKLLKARLRDERENDMQVQLTSVPIQRLKAKKSKAVNLKPPAQAVDTGGRGDADMKEI